MSSEITTLLGIGIIFTSILLGKIVGQVGAIIKEKAAGAREEAYQKLAERVAAAELSNSETLSEINARLAAIEKLLRQVE